MENTNLQNLRTLLEHYIPKTCGIVTYEEYLSITTILHLEGMNVTDLLNLRDFVVSFFSKEYGAELDIADKDRLGAIKAVIGKEIVKKGGTMEEVRVRCLKHIGRDSWDRPVYRDDEGILWKDVDPRADRKPNLCTSVDNEFDGEPDTGMEHFQKYRDVSVVFVPERDVW